MGSEVHSFLNVFHSMFSLNVLQKLFCISGTVLRSVDIVLNKILDVMEKKHT